MEKEITKEYILQKFDGHPVCPHCGSYIQLLPEFHIAGLYAYRCACNSPTGWSYVSNLSGFNPAKNRG